jgi:sterol desaturase/sphingolipid hydroxylase (fatty acid hydroxylase superfamily)
LTVPAALMPIQGQMFRECAFRLFIYFALAAPFVILERILPARDVHYRKVLLRDLGAYLLVFCFSTAIGLALQKVLAHWPIDSFLKRIPELPYWQKLAISTVGNEITLYWIHRGMHTSVGWPAHRWHHSAKQMYWLSGVRASVVHVALFTVPVIWPIVLKAPASMYVIAVAWAILTQHWMHANFTFRARWLEWFVITPRAHHLHHSDDPAHFGTNFGSFFSVWDRLFGTYLDPDTVKQPVRFGIPEKVHPARIYLGI